MSRLVSAPRRWFSLGLLLPAEVRRRLFEPAYYDLLREHLSERPRQRANQSFALEVFGLFVGSSLQGVQLVLRNRQFMDRALVGLTVTAAVASLVVVFLLWDWIQFIASQ